MILRIPLTRQKLALSTAATQTCTPIRIRRI